MKGALIKLVVICCLALGFGCTGGATPRPIQGLARNFAECVAQGGKMLKSYPAQCVTPEGERFVDQRSVDDSFAPSKGCKDLCGNGRCEEIVCMAIGCPCAESHATCPKDCP